MTGEGGCLVVNSEAEAALAETISSSRVLATARRHRRRCARRQIQHDRDCRRPRSRSDSSSRRIQRAALGARAILFRLFRRGIRNAIRAELPVADFEQSNWHMFHLVLPDRISRAHFMQRMLDFNIGVDFTMRLFTSLRSTAARLQGRHVPGRRAGLSADRHVAALPRDDSLRCRKSSDGRQIDTSSISPKPIKPPRADRRDNQRAPARFPHGCS